MAFEAKKAEKSKVRDIMYNSIQVPAIWESKKEDIWEFDDTAGSLRQIIFRTTHTQEYLREIDARILFELVAYVKDSEDESKITEMSCGWSELSLDDIQGKSNGRALNIQGGSPFAQMEISNNEIRSKRTGLSAVQKAFTGVQKRVVVDILPFALLKDEKHHLSLMPATCLLHGSLLTFLSGFMNYKATKLLGEQGTFMRPTGDVVLNSFPRIYDNPDIIEDVSYYWNDYIAPEIKKSGYLNCDFIMEKTAYVCKRVYPILYSDEFKNIEFINTTKSGAGLKNSQGEDLVAARKKLVNSALKFGSTVRGKEVIENPSDLTSYKPFSIRELDVQVWDISRSKQEHIMSQFHEANCYCQGNGDHDHEHDPSNEQF